jgi:hypothetical protein
VYLLFSINVKTESNVTDIKDTIQEVEAELEVERQLREERLVNYTTCLLQTPIELRTDDRVADCREASGLSRTPPTQPSIETVEGKEPSSRGSVPSNQSSASSSGLSSSQGTPNTVPTQRQSSPNSENEETEAADPSTEPEPTPITGITIIDGLLHAVGL